MLLKKQTKTVEVKKYDLNEIKRSYEKHKTLLFVLIFGLIAFALIKPYIFDTEIFLPHDGRFHYNRLCDLTESIKEGNLRPYLYFDTINQYGGAQAFAYGDLFLYPFAILCVLGISYGTSFRLLMCVTVFFSGVSFYFSAIKIFNKSITSKLIPEEACFLSACFYMINPLLLVDFYLRYGIGELLSFVFLPLICLGVYNIFKTQTKPYILALSMSGLILSSIQSTIIISVFLFAYYIISLHKIIKKPKIIIKTLQAALLCIGLCSYYIFPLLEQILFQPLGYSNKLLTTFGPLSNYTWLFKNELPEIVKIAITISLIVFLILLCVRCNSSFIKCFAVTIFTLFAITDIFCWNTLEQIFEPINFIQFPWRLLMILGLFFPISLLGLLSHISPKTLLTIGITISLGLMFIPLEFTELVLDEENAKAFYFDKDQRVNYDILAETGTSEYLPYCWGEYLVDNFSYKDIDENGNVYLAYHEEKSPDFFGLRNKLEPNNLKNKIIKENQTTTIFIEPINKNKIQLTIPLFYYKGYEIKINNKEKIYSYTKDNKGLISIQFVPDKTNTNVIQVKYVGTDIQQYAILVSCLTLVLLIIFLSYKKIRLQ